MTIARRSSSPRALAALLLAVAVAATVPVGILATVLPRPVFPPPPPLAIQSVTISPDPPAPDAPVIVTVQLSHGGTSVAVGLGYVAGFGSRSSGGLGLTPAAARTFRGSIGPFQSGTEVWYVVIATAPGEDPVQSDYSVFRVGPVLRGGPSSLAIANVTRSPIQPSPFDSVTVRAEVRSNWTLTAVDLQSLEIGPGFAFGMFSLMDPDGGNYTRLLYPTPETRVAYRVIAQDETGNTAISAVFTYVVPPGPGPFP